MRRAARGERALRSPAPGGSWSNSPMAALSLSRLVLPRGLEHATDEELAGGGNSGLGLRPALGSAGRRFQRPRPACRHLRNASSYGSPRRPAPHRLAKAAAARANGAKAAGPRKSGQALNGRPVAVTLPCRKAASGPSRSRARAHIANTRMSQSSPPRRPRHRTRPHPCRPLGRTDACRSRRRRDQGREPRRRRRHAQMGPALRHRRGRREPVGRLLPRLQSRQALGCRSISRRPKAPRPCESSSPAPTC